MSIQRDGAYHVQPITSPPAITGVALMNGARSDNVSAMVPPRQSTFYQAVTNGDAKELCRLLGNESLDINVNRYDSDGQTALHKSCMDGRIELVKLLVNFGADVSLANRDGWSSLHIAAYAGHKDIVQFLLFELSRDN